MRRTKYVFLITLAVLLHGCSRPPQPTLQSSASSAKIDNPATSKPITEDQALDLLFSALKQHKVTDLDCLSFMTGNNYPVRSSKAVRWEFAAREIHNDRCGGDPGVSPVRDRYEVSASGMVRVYDVANDRYTEL